MSGYAGSEIVPDVEFTCLHPSDKATTVSIVWGDRSCTTLQKKVPPGELTRSVRDEVGKSAALHTAELSDTGPTEQQGRHFSYSHHKESSTKLTAVRDLISELSFGLQARVVPQEDQQCTYSVIPPHPHALSRSGFHESSAKTVGGMATTVAHHAYNNHVSPEPPLASVLSRSRQFLGYSTETSDRHRDCSEGAEECTKAEADGCCGLEVMYVSDDEDSFSVQQGARKMGRTGSRGTRKKHCISSRWAFSICARSCGFHSTILKEWVTACLHR